MLLLSCCDGALVAGADADPTAELFNDELDRGIDHATLRFHSGYAPEKRSGILQLFE